MHTRLQIPPIESILAQDPISHAPLAFFPESPDDPPLMDAVIVTRGAWSSDEDALLRNAVTRFGLGQWDVIAAVIPGRSATQCRERWTFRIGPGLNKGPFEQWEDELIVKERERFGNHWTLISSHLIGRTSCAVKNRWYSVLRKHYKKRSNEKHTPSFPFTLTDLLSHPVRHQCLRMMFL
jgi:hypothetical protein